MSENQIMGLKLLILICDRGNGSKAMTLLEDHGATYGLIALGHGTANSDILDCLGIGETEKDVLLCGVPSEKSKELLQYLSDSLHLDMSGRGIAFTVPVSSAGGLKVIEAFRGHFSEQEEGAESK